MNSDIYVEDAVLADQPELRRTTSSHSIGPFPTATPVFTAPIFRQERSPPSNEGQVKAPGPDQ